MLEGEADRSMTLGKICSWKHDMGKYLAALLLLDVVCTPCSEHPVT